MCLPPHFNSCTLYVSVRKKKKKRLPELLCIPSLYLLRVLNVAHFSGKKKEKGRVRDKKKKLKSLMLNDFHH